MFKVLHFYGTPGWNPYNVPLEKKPIRGGQERKIEFDLFSDVIQQDMLLLMKLIAWMRKNPQNAAVVNSETLGTD